MQETNRIEYKQSLTDGLEKEVIAFLNSNHGGAIYLGIDKHGQAVGIENSDDVQLKIKDCSTEITIKSAKKPHFGTLLRYGKP